MPFDSLTLTGLSYELNQKLTQARVYKIYQPRRDELLIVLRSPEGNLIDITISANATSAHIHLSQVHPKNPKQAPTFCMLLRKYLEGARIEAVTQDGLDRILRLEMLALNNFHEWERKTLVCEFMGKHSNIILINPIDGHIIDAIHRYSHETSSYREVLPGRIYVSPPPQKRHSIFNITPEQFLQLTWQLENTEILSDAIFQIVEGLSRNAASYFCFACNLDPKMHIDECSLYEFRLLHQNIQQTIQRLKNGNQPGYLIKQKGKYKDFAAYPLFSSEGTLIQTDTICQAVTCFFDQKEEIQQIEQIRQTLLHQVKSLLEKSYRKQHFHFGDRNQAIQNEKYKIWGELLTAYAWQFKKGDTKAVLQDFYTCENVTIMLDPRYTPIENAQRFFKIYNKSRRALTYLENLIQENEQEINYLENTLLAIELAENIQELTEIRSELIKQNYIKEPIEKGKKEIKRKKEQKLPPRSFTSSDGFSILVGRNSLQNDWLVRHMETSDLWFHTQKIASSHVIVSLPKEIKTIRDVPNQTLLEAAMLTAYYSQGRANNKVPVDYTFLSNVKKPAGVKPGFVIYENYLTLLVNPNSEKMEELLKQRKE